MSINRRHAFGANSAVHFAPASAFPGASGTRVHLGPRRLESGANWTAKFASLAQTLACRGSGIQTHAAVVTFFRRYCVEKRQTVNGARFLLGLAVGVLLALNTLLSVLPGGCVPLALRRIGVDPARASGAVKAGIFRTFFGPRTWLLLLWEANTVRRSGP